jgi:riboflavin kinase/FMN adenylyltransferase
VQHIRGLENLKLDGCALTIGAFDGVHVGHQAMIGAMVEHARRTSLPAVVLTFHPHPLVVLRGPRPAFYLTGPEERAQLLGRLGAEIVVTHPFTTAFSRTTAGGFLDLVSEHLAFRDLWVGEDFAFGHQREGNVPFLERAAPQRGFRLHVIPPVTVDGEVVSSNRVRESLRAGDLVRAARLLGRPFAFTGTVVRDTGRGGALGVPTANLSVGEEQARPGPGTYACLAEAEGRLWKAVSNIGNPAAPGDDSGQAIVEAHLIGFDEDLHGRPMRLVFVERLRGERPFPDPEALREQVRQDIQRAEEILATVETPRWGV